MKPLSQYIVPTLMTCTAVSAQAAGPMLYETGPAQDSAFVRFVNGLDQAVEVVPEGDRARLSLPTSKPLGDFLPVRPDTVIKGAFEARGQRAGVAVKTAPGAFSTVVARSAGAGKPFTVTVLTEVPDDFSALRASLGFASLDKACAPAGLQTAGKGGAVFRRGPGAAPAPPDQPGQAHGAGHLRQQAGGQHVVDLGQLEAGQRYNLLLMPSAGRVPRVVFAADTVTR